MKDKILNDDRYLNDCLSLLLVQGYPARIIRQKLSLKRLDSGAIDAAMKARYAASASHGLDVELESAHKYMDRRRSVFLKHIDNHSKNLQRLSTAGFGYRTAKAALSAFEVHHKAACT